MKKVVIASLLACAALVPAVGSAVAQQAVNLGAQSKPNAPCQMPDAEYKAYTDALNQTDPKAKAAAIEAYLQAFPTSACPDTRVDLLVVLMATYSGFDPAKTLDAADRVLKLDPNNLRALTFEAYLRKQQADSEKDPNAKQAALDAAAGFAQKGLSASKPEGMSDADFKTLQSTAFPIFYSAIATDDLNKKDAAGAVDNFKKELSSVPADQTTKPGPILQDTYFLALAYLQSNPPDYLDCAFYAARFVAYAPEPFKSQITPTAHYCYKKYHGGDDGFDAVQTAAQASLEPPAGFKDTIKPAPTPADIVNQVIATTPDLSTLAVSDREFILQNGTPDQADKVWETMKGKSVQLNGTVIAATPSQLQVAVSDDAKQAKTADFTVDLKTPEEAKTAAARAAQKKHDDAVAAATAPGQTVDFSGTYDSYTQKPVMIHMTDGEVILPKAVARPAAGRAPARRPAAH